VSPWLRLPLPARGSSGAATCHLSSTHLLAQGSTRATMCHLGCKQINKYPLPTRSSCSPSGRVHPYLPRSPTIMISIEAGTPISSKALCDKGCSARSQGVQQVTH
jgi:hypothetical protein